MGERIAGIAFVKCDGRQFALRGSFVVSPSPAERTGIAGQDGVHGYIETPRIPFIAGNLSTTSDLSVEELDAMTDITVTAELANGKNYVASNAWTKSAHEIDTAQGMVAVRWESHDIQEF
jgi:hypothetical protein